ncbi:MAG: SHOCT domain-containing protein [Clostridia bacterium]|nr:SHOCT domain-containing protein [Clostridia bacterium]
MCIPLKSIISVQQTSNFGISQTVTVVTNEKKNRFVVFHGKDWVAAIEKAKNGNVPTAAPLSVNQQTNDYTDELRKLKELLDAGIITEEEFAIKKRQILNI